MRHTAHLKSFCLYVCADLYHYKNSLEGTKKQKAQVVLWKGKKKNPKNKQKNQNQQKKDLLLCMTEITLIKSVENAISPVQGNEKSTVYL